MGIIKLPIDGNPNHSMGLISHPDDITGIGVSKDGRYLFTAGGDDYSVNIWAIDLSVIHQNIVLRKYLCESLILTLQKKEKRIYSQIYWKEEEKAKHIEI